MKYQWLMKHESERRAHRIRRTSIHALGLHFNAEKSKIERSRMGATRRRRRSEEGKMRSGRKGNEKKCTHENDGLWISQITRVLFMLPIIRRHDIHGAVENAVAGASLRLVIVAGGGSIRSIMEHQLLRQTKLNLLETIVRRTICERRCHVLISYFDSVRSSMRCACTLSCRR